MKGNRLVCILMFWFSISYSQEKNIGISISVDTLLTGKMSIRSLVADKNKIWYAADQGRYGYVDFASNTVFEKRIVFDSLKPEFRSMAQTSSSIFILSIGNPALLYKIDKQTGKTRLVYRETHEKSFTTA